MSQPTLYDIYFSLIKAIQKDVSQISILTTIQKKIGVRPGVCIFWSLILLTLLSLFGFVQQYGIVLVGSFYPIYATLNSIKQKNKQRNNHWLLYWIVFGFLTLSHTSLSIIFSFIPFYYTIKLLLVVGLIYPTSQWAQNGLNILMKNKQPIRKLVKKVSDKVQS